jgi:L-2-hydroxyglutarate oxidase LhgO
MGGGFRFGPDLKYLNPPHVDYSLGVDQSIAFEKSVQRWWPDLPISMMQPDGCGIRPRVLRDPNKQSDFVFLSPQDHGIEGLVQMFGVESPGLTSALAIANLVTELLEQPVN